MDHSLPADDDENEPSPTRELSWLHENSAQVTACLSNFSASYNVVNISLVLPILELLHPDATSNDEALCASSLLAGMMVGQVLGGALGDTVWLGRLGALRLVMALQVLASLASASIGLFVGPVRNVFMWLAFWRFILGVGCGGVYPLAAVLSAEQATASTAAATTIAAAAAAEDHSVLDDIPSATTNVDVMTDGIFRDENQRPHQVEDEDTSKSIHRVVLTFSTQGLGFVAVPIVAVILLFLTTDLDLIWRLMLGLGAVPGIILMAFQGYCLGFADGRCSSRYAEISQRVQVEDEWQIDYNIDGENNEDGADGQEHVEVEDGTCESNSVQANDFNANVIEHRNSRDNVHHTRMERRESSSQPSPEATTSMFHEPRLGRKLLGTAGTWFLFDVVFYGNIIFQPIVVEAAFGSSSSLDPIHLLRKTAINSLILTSLALPGYAVSGFILGKKTCCILQTPRYVMLQGFAAMALLYFSIGLNWSYLRGYPSMLVFLYGGTFFFANYGPNTTTFILPSLLFEKEHRATWNGISAAAGKLGALTGATLFAPAAKALGNNVVMFICSGVAVLAYALTLLFVPSQHDMRHS